MTSPRCDEQTFIRLFQTKGAALTAAELGVAERKVYERRRAIEGRLGIELRPPLTKARNVNLPEHPQRQKYSLTNGTVLIGSDAHYWPNYISTAHRAFVKACDWFKPEIVVMNGDVVDGATISRHQRIGWEQQPSFKQELDTAKERLGEIQDAAKNAKLCWTLGNHDARFETTLANKVPEVEGLEGVHLKDHFPEWAPCYAVWINDEVVIKHRFRGGIHATHNNTLWAGKTVVTGHLHSLKVTPLSDYNGVRYGVDCGTLAHPYWPQFRDYTEDNPLNWRSGFAVLTFEDGRLLWPSLAHVIDEEKGLIEFERKVFAV